MCGCVDAWMSIFDKDIYDYFRPFSRDNLQVVLVLHYTLYKILYYKRQEIESESHDAFFIMSKFYWVGIGKGFSFYSS